MTHTCHAVACSRKVSPRLLMCAPHWRAVPPDVQRLVWATYVRGQEQTKTPSRAYLAVQALAVALVAKGEGRKTEALEAMLRAMDWTKGLPDGGVHDAIRGRVVQTVQRSSLDM